VILVPEKLSKLMVFKFDFKHPNSRFAVQRARCSLAKFLKTKGFEPGHWYANWKELEKDVWLTIGGGDQSNSVLSVEVTLRDSPPNVGGIEYYTEEVEKFRKYCEQKVKPMVLSLLDESKIPYNILEANATKV